MTAVYDTHRLNLLVQWDESLNLNQYYKRARWKKIKINKAWAWHEWCRILLQFKNQPDLSAVSVGTSRLSYWGTLSLVYSRPISPGQRVLNWYHLTSEASRRRKDNRIVVFVQNSLSILETTFCWPSWRFIHFWKYSFGTLRILD